MRVIVYGVGAIGGVVAACLHRAGTEVIGIARGARLAAIREKGLMLRTHDGEHRVPLACCASAGEVDFRPDDVILLATKTQDTVEALGALRAAGVHQQAIFCAQNGIENERLALRIFPNVHAINVMMPAEYTDLDEALAFGQPRYGIFDIGRYPSGQDAADLALARALEEANIAAYVHDTVMEQKYGKLIVNLGNIVDAALGTGVSAPEITGALRAEGESIYKAAGIAWADMGAADPRRDELLRINPLPGRKRIGSSSSQSLARGAGSIETDYMNGEIALIARLNGTEAPLNARAAAIAAKLSRERTMPGSMTPKQLSDALGL